MKSDDLIGLVKSGDALLCAAAHYWQSFVTVHGMAPWVDGRREPTDDRINTISAAVFSRDVLHGKVKVDVLDRDKMKTHIRNTYDEVERMLFILAQLEPWLDEHLEKDSS